MLKTLTALAVTAMIGSSPVKAQPNLNPDTERPAISHSTTPNVRAPRKFTNPVKLTVRHFPLHRIFADDDDDDSLSVAQHAMLTRRNHQVEIVDDVADSSAEDISDSIRLRLLIARLRAMNAYDLVHGQKG